VRDTGTARLDQGIEACRDIDAVTAYVVILDDDVAKIDPDAELDAP